MWSLPLLAPPPFVSAWVPFGPPPHHLVAPLVQVIVQVVPALSKSAIEVGVSWEKSVREPLPQFSLEYVHVMVYALFLLPPEIS